jgi:NAD-dependent dihydropyrimidine dehydrogenase PreA subunit
MSVNVNKVVSRDIADLGREGLRVIDKVGMECSHTFADCAACKECVLACPEKALTMEEVNDEVALNLRMDRCNGTACLRCERACPRGGFRFIDLCFKGIGKPKRTPV